MGGVFLAASCPLPVGAWVSMRFRLPTGSVTGAGTVRWVREAGPGRMGGMGIALTEISHEDRDTLRRFCEGSAPVLSYAQVVAATH
jgi:hypothetical protein